MCVVTVKFNCSNVRWLILAAWKMEWYLFACGGWEAIQSQRSFAKAFGAAYRQYSTLEWRMASFSKDLRSFLNYITGPLLPNRPTNTKQGGHRMFGSNTEPKTSHVITEAYDLQPVLRSSYETICARKGFPNPTRSVNFTPTRLIQYLNVPSWSRRLHQLQREPVAY